MAEVQLQGNTIVIVAGGQRRSSGVSVRAGMSETDVRGAINAALANVRSFFDGAGIDLGATDVTGAASRIHRQLNPEAQPAEPARREPARREPARRETPRRERREEPAREEPRRGREERDVRAATPRRTFPTEATEVVPWVTLQMRESARDERRSVAASSTLHSNREFMNQFLSPDLQRSTTRTANQRDVTIAVFNALYQTANFRLYLSSVAASEGQYFPQFVQLQAFLTDPGRSESLSDAASADIIRAADMYIRYFLYGFVAPNEANARFRAEVAQLPNAERVRLRIHESRTFTATSGRQPDERTRYAFIAMNIGGAIDSDTVTSAGLYIRRWTQQHPERGRGRTEDQIAQWAAPQIVPIEGTPTPQVQVAVPRVAVVGDSLIAGGRIGTTLQRVLREGTGATPEAVVDTYGGEGDALARVRTRFNDDVLGHRPPYNVVVIHAGVNGIGGQTVERLEMEYARFIAAARERGMRVVIMGLLPWEGSTNSTSELQRRTTQFNQWLHDQATADGNVVFIDTAALIGEGNPPRLRQQYERATDPDHLHPSDAGRDILARQIAQSAFGRTISTGETRTALQDFADQHWRNLTAELYQSTQGGRPAGIVTIMRNLPQGHASVEDALRVLNRTDVRDAFDRIFNEYLHTNRDFLEFCRGRDDFQGVARESTRLSGTTSDTDRRRVMRALAHFINHEAQRTGETYTRLRQDLALLYRQGFSMGRDDYDPDGRTDMRLMAAIAVYSWRIANPTAAVGDWAQSLGIRPQTREPQRQEPPPVVEPPPGTQRRRVIHPGGG
jgi:lysophospholipase L1-like esterase